MSTNLYFAYGSNLLGKLLQARFPGAVVEDVASQPQHRHVFAKRSKDGSGKEAFEAAPGAALPCVLWCIPKEEHRALDEAEDVGYSYEARTIEVACVGGSALEKSEAAQS